MSRQRGRGSLAPVTMLGGGRQTPPLFDSEPIVIPAPIREIRHKRPATPVERRIPRKATVLGLDLAARRTGWALVQRGSLEFYGEFTLPTSRRVRETRPAFLVRRAQELGSVVSLLVRSYHPDAVAYEYPDQTRPAWSGGSKGREFIVARALGRVEMALLLACHVLDVEVLAVPVSAAKVAVGGNIGAKKLKIRQGTERLLGLERGALDDMTDDEIDAASIALTVLED